MPNENPNNDFHWKNKLESLESLPGERLDKEASWEKLHSRLRKSRNGKRALWYWAAAACLLLALLTPWFLLNKKEGVLVKNSGGQQKNQIPPAHLIPGGNKDSIAFISAISIEKEMPVSTIKKKNRINALVNHGTLTIENVAVQKNSEEFIKPEVPDNVIPSLDTQVSIIAIVPEKKKLPVVHINELGDPVEELSVARKTERHSFQMKFANQEVFVNPSITSAKTGFTIYQQKNSPN